MCLYGALQLLLWAASVTTSLSVLDISTLIPCGNVGFPADGSGVRSCFQRVISSGTCDLVPLETTSITTIGNTIKIFSPDFGIENTTYPNDILCQYALPSCPSEGSLMHISWFSGLFVLEPPGINGPFTICSDFLRFFNLPLDLAALGLELDSFGVLCDQQNTFFEQFSGPPLLAEFRSGMMDAFLGFAIDVICAPPIAMEQLAGTGVSCTEVEGEVPLPDPEPIKYVPKTGGSGIIVPRPAFLTYSDYILKMVTKNGKVLQKLFGIKKLAFSTGFNGTRVFVRSALVPLDEIFGGGTLYVKRGSAFYKNSRIPPKFEPNTREKEIMSVILNALNPLFLEQSDDAVIPDPGAGGPPGFCVEGSVRLVGGSAVRGRVELCRKGVWGTVCDDFWDGRDAEVVCRQLGLPSSNAKALRGGEVAAGTGSIFLDDVMCTGEEGRLLDCKHAPLGVHNCRHREDAGVSCQGHGPISNPKVDQEALKLSNQFVDACNPFLREVSRSFLEAADPKGVPFKKPYYH